MMFLLTSFFSYGAADHQLFTDRNPHQAVRSITTREIESTLINPHFCLPNLSRQATVIAVGRELLKRQKSEIRTGKQLYLLAYMRLALQDGDLLKERRAYGGILRPLEENLSHIVAQTNGYHQALIWRGRFLSKYAAKIAAESENSEERYLIEAHKLFHDAYLQGATKSTLLWRMDLFLKKGLRRIEEGGDLLTEEDMIREVERLKNLFDTPASIEDAVDGTNHEVQYRNIPAEDDTLPDSLVRNPRITTDAQKALAKELKQLLQTKREDERRVQLNQAVDIVAGPDMQVDETIEVEEDSPERALLEADIQFDEVAERELPPVTRDAKRKRNPNGDNDSSIGEEPRKKRAAKKSTDIYHQKIEEIANWFEVNPTMPRTSDVVRKKLETEGWQESGIQLLINKMLRNGTIISIALEEKKRKQDTLGKVRTYLLSLPEKERTTENARKFLKRHSDYSYSSGAHIIESLQKEGLVISKQGIARKERQLAFSKIEAWFDTEEAAGRAPTQQEFNEELSKFDNLNSEQKSKIRRKMAPRFSKNS